MYAIRSYYAKEPSNARYYLRRGELLEILNDVKEARNVYKKGMKNISSTSPEHQLLTYQLAILCATDLYDLDTAEELLEKLPFVITSYSIHYTKLYESAKNSRANTVNVACSRVPPTTRHHSSEMLSVLRRVRNNFV